MSNPPTPSYAVIPCYILDDESLDEGAKTLYARISMYSQDGRCWASNQHFANKQKVTIRCIQKWLAELVEAGYIEVEVERGGFQTKRNIWLVVDFKKNFTKRTTVHAAVNVDAPQHEPQFMQINTSNINIKEQQQQEPVAAVSSNKFFPLLKDIDIPLSDKEWLSSKFSEAEVFHAVQWATHPSTKLNKPLAAALKWACQNKPEIPKLEIDTVNENKEFSKSIEMKYNSVNGHKIEALSSFIEISCGQFTHTLDYSENGFKEQLNSILKKRGIL